MASPVLVFGLHLGLNGSAVANVLAQVVAAGLCVWALRREHVPARPRWTVMRRQLALSRDLVLRSLAFQAAYLSAAAVAGRMGAAQLAAHQIGLQLWEFVALLLDSFAIAAQSLVGAALGAGDAVIAVATAWRVSRYGLGAGIAFAAVFAAGWNVIPASFSNDPGVRDQAHLLWPLLVAMMPAAGVVFALDGVLLGAGDNAFMRTLTLAAAIGGYVPIAWASLRFGWGIAGVWCGLAAFIVIRLVATLWRTSSRRWLVLGSD